MENNNGFTEGKVLSPLIRFALPILFAIFLQTMYGAVDMLVVGNSAMRERFQPYPPAVG